MTISKTKSTKRFFQTLLPLLLLYLATLSSAQTEFSVYKATVLRAESSATSKSLASIPTDSKVLMLMIKSTEGYFPVKFGNLIGWIDSKTVFRSEVETIGGSGDSFLVVKIEKAQVLTKPLTTSSPLFTARRGMKLDISDSSTKNWYRIRLYNGFIGWISANDVTLESEP